MSGSDDDAAGRRPSAPLDTTRAPPAPAPVPADGGRVSGVIAAHGVAAQPALALAPPPLPRHDADGVVLDDDDYLGPTPYLDPRDPRVAAHQRLRPTVGGMVGHIGRHPQFRDVLAWDAERDALVFRAPPPWGAHDRPDAPFVEHQAVTSDDHARICGWIERTASLDVQIETARRAARVVGQRRTVRPMRDWLMNLPTWDGVPRLDSWMVDILGCDAGPYATQLGRRWMLGVVERLVSPGARAGRTLAIVDDGKGVDVMRALCPSPDRFLEADTNTTAAHDLVATSRGVLLAYCPVDGTSRSVTRALALAGRGSDAYRPNYEEGGVRQARCHTTVVALYEVDALDDERLSRGCLPILCGITPGAMVVAAAARDLLLAEARDRLARGELPALDGADLAELSVTKGFGDMEWSELLTPISLFLVASRDKWVSRGYVHIPEIVRDALGIPPERASRALSIRVSKVLLSLGWRRGNKRTRRIEVAFPGAAVQLFPWYPSEAALREIAAATGVGSGDTSTDTDPATSGVNGER